MLYCMHSLADSFSTVFIFIIFVSCYALPVRSAQLRRESNSAHYRETIWVRIFVCGAELAVQSQLRRRIYNLYNLLLDGLCKCSHHHHHHHHHHHQIQQHKSACSTMTTESLHPMIQSYEDEAWQTGKEWSQQNADAWPQVGARPSDVDRQLRHFTRRCVCVDDVQA